MRASIQCDITLDGVRLPAAAVLPGARGLKGPFSCLNEARYGIVWGAAGAARACFEAAIRLLKPDGILVFEVPLIRAPDDIWLRTSLEHIHYPTERSLRYLFEEVLGLEHWGAVVEVQDFSCIYVGVTSRLRENAAALRARMQHLTEAPPGSLAPEEAYERAAALGAAAGSGVGLLGGSAYGAGNAQRGEWTLQDRYDVAYMQCMYTKGNQIPVPAGSQPAYSQQGYTRHSFLAHQESLPPGVPPPPSGEPPPPPADPSR
jgi:hypothetical protein